jgi:hypothetical protein
MLIRDLSLTVPLPQAKADAGARGSSYRTRRNPKARSPWPHSLPTEGNPKASACRQCSLPAEGNPEASTCHCPRKGKDVTTGLWVQDPRGCNYHPEGSALVAFAFASAPLPSLLIVPPVPFGSKSRETRPTPKKSFSEKMILVWISKNRLTTIQTQVSSAHFYDTWPKFRVRSKRTPRASPSHAQLSTAALQGSQHSTFRQWIRWATDPAEYNGSGHHCPRTPKYVQTPSGQLRTF